MLGHVFEKIQSEKEEVWFDIYRSISNSKSEDAAEIQQRKQRRAERRQRRLMRKQELRNQRLGEIDRGIESRRRLGVSRRYSGAAIIGNSQFQRRGGSQSRMNGPRDSENETNNRS